MMCRSKPSRVPDIGLGKSLYTNEQLDEFPHFKTARGLTPHTWQLACHSKNENGGGGRVGFRQLGSINNDQCKGMKFILMNKVIGQFIVFVSLILMVWGGLLLIITVFLRIFIIAGYQACWIWALAALWGRLFQLAMSPFNCIDKMMEDVSEKVGKMVSMEVPG
jgi:hypothetical protein